MKTLVYAGKTNSRDALLRRIFDAAEHIRDNPGIFGRIIAETSSLKVY
jgi:hypothetical protein